MKRFMTPTIPEGCEKPMTECNDMLPKDDLSKVPRDTAGA